MQVKPLKLCKLHLLSSRDAIDLKIFNRTQKVKNESFGNFRILTTTGFVAHAHAHKIIKKEIDTPIT